MGQDRSDREQGRERCRLYKTLLLDGLWVRLDTYLANSRADDWCSKGHLVHCLEGELESEMVDGRVVRLKEGVTYVVSDQLSSHRSYSRNGVTLLIMDGAFLQLTNGSHASS